MSHLKISDPCYLYVRDFRLHYSPHSKYNGRKLKTFETHVSYPKDIIINLEGAFLWRKGLLYVHLHLCFPLPLVWSGIYSWHKVAAWSCWDYSSILRVFFSDCRSSVSFFFTASALISVNVADHWFRNEIHSNELVGFHLYTDRTKGWIGNVRVSAGGK